MNTNYQNAIKIFGDIERHVTSAQNPVAFDLCNGLRALSQALAQDSQELRAQVDQIEIRLQALEARLTR